MTGLSRAAERAARRKRRRNNVRHVIAGFCVTAGVLLFVSVQLKGHRSPAAGAPTKHGPSSSTTASPPAGSVPTQEALPIVSNGAGNGSGPAAFSDPVVVSAVMAAAKSGIQAVDSYDYRNLNAAIAAGLAATTGQFQTSYRAAMTGAVAATAPQSEIVQLATVEKVGICSLSADSTRASALVFGRLQISNSSTGNTPTRTPITLGVTLDNVAGTWLISAVNDFSTSSGEAQPPGTRALYDAALAGAQEVVNLLTYRRASFDDDFARAGAGLTGALLTQQQGQKSAILAELTSAGADYVGKIRCIGIESVTDDTVLMLVAATSYTVSAGVSSIQALPKFEVGVTRIQGHWFVDQFQAIGAD